MFAHFIDRGRGEGRGGTVDTGVIPQLCVTITVEVQRSGFPSRDGVQSESVQEGQAAGGSYRAGR